MALSEHADLAASRVHASQGSTTKDKFAVAINLVCATSVSFHSKHLLQIPYAYIAASRTMNYYIDLWIPNAIYKRKTAGYPGGLARRNGVHVDRYSLQTNMCGFRITMQFSIHLKCRNYLNIWFPLGSVWIVCFLIYLSSVLTCNPQDKITTRMNCAGPSFPDFESQRSACWGCSQYLSILEWRINRVFIRCHCISKTLANTFQNLLETHSSWCIFCYLFHSKRWKTNRFENSSCFIKIFENYSGRYGWKQHYQIIRGDHVLLDKHYSIILEVIIC